MDVALVENTQDEVNDEQCRPDQQRHGRERGLECLRIALEAVSIVAGIRSRLGFSIASVASPSATPWARLKLMVMAGNWPWWLIDRRLDRMRRPFGEGREAAPAARWSAT